MCLAIPARIVELEDDRAVAEAMGTRWKIRTTLTPQIGLGDIVLVHAGYAITKVDEAEARKTWELFEEIAQMEAKEQQVRRQEDPK